MKHIPTRLSLHSFVLALLAGLCLSLSTNAAAQWKWRDKNNSMQYSDLPPPSTVPESAILQRPQGASRRAATPTAPAVTSTAAGVQTAASGPTKTVDPELEAKRKKVEQEEAEKRKAEESKLAASKLENCTRAKAQIKIIEDGVRIVRANAKGEHEFLDDKARTEETNRARQIVASDCPK